MTENDSEIGVRDCNMNLSCGFWGCEAINEEKEWEFGGK